jgi:polyvinyl alcohol dehydrogenase (cytochrome)
VAGLIESWMVEVGGPVSATPVIHHGVAYVGSYDGLLYAIDIFSGSVIWTYDTGAAVMEPNLQIPLGITGSAAVVGGVVYVGDATATVHAIETASGTAIWTRQVDDQPNASIWSSPIVWNDQLVVGVASVAKETGFSGSVVALDTETGEPIWQTFVMEEGADGGGVFSVPAIDPERGVLYVGTQNAYSESPAPYGNPTSMLALDFATGDVVWAFNAPPNDGETAPVDDVAFSASPNLFSIEIDGESRDVVGQGQKSGAYWVVDRETGAVIWSREVSPPGFLGGMEGTSAAANGVIAVPATDWPEFEGPASGLVSGLDMVTGDVLWTAQQEAPAASPAAISNDLVFHAGFDGILHAYGLQDGLEIWSSELGASVSGGIAVASGVVILGAATPQFAPFITPGNLIHGFALPGDDATPVDMATPEDEPPLAGETPQPPPEASPEA